jgi:hypothetical protein
MADSYVSMAIAAKKKKTRPAESKSGGEGKEVKNKRKPRGTLYN